MGLFRLFVLALVAYQCRAEGWFESGQEYHYSYSAQTISGVQEPASFGSSVSINANLVIQQSGGLAVAKLSDVTLAVHNGPISLLRSVKYQKNKPELAPLEKPFKISFSRGKVNGLDAESSDPDWSINIKKALATMLQVDLVAGDNFGKGDNAFIRTVEDTISGMCNTSYSFGTGERGQQVLIKQRSQSECINGAPRVLFNTIDAVTCAGKRLEEVTSTTTQTIYQFTRISDKILRAHTISSIGYQHIQFHPPSGAPFYNQANTTLVFKSSGPITKPIATGTLTKLYGSLRYIVKRPIPSPEEVDLAREEDFFYPDEPLTQAAIRTKALLMLNKLKATVTSLPLEEERAQDPTVIVTIQLFSSMNLESLRVIYTNIEKQDDLRNLYVQILPLCGSNPAALRIKEMIIQGKLSDREAGTAIVLVPFHLRLPTEKLLTSYEDLLAENPFIKSKELKGTIAMAFAHLVGVTCNPNRPRPCRSDNLNKYGRMAYESFRNARTHPEMMVTLLALRNTKQPALIEKLIPLTKSGAVSHAFRPNVIHALREISQTHRKQFLAAIMPILLNTTETTEIRVAAVDSLFQSKPPFLELQQLVSVVLWEKNKEVRNYIITRLKEAADSKNPCVKPVSIQMQNILRRIAHIKTNPYGSSSRSMNFQDETYGFGGGFQLATVYGEESRAPLIVTARYTHRVGETTFAPIIVYIRLEGIDEAFVRAFRRVDPNDFKLDVLKDLLLRTMKIQPRSQAPLKMEIIFRFQGYNVWYRHLDGESIKEFMDPRKFAEMMSQGLMMSKNTYIGVALGQYVSWRANDMGIPVGVGTSSPGFSRVLFASWTPANLPPGKMARSLAVDLDEANMGVTYMAFHLVPLGANQGIIKITGTRTHLPMNITVGISPAEGQIEIKLNTSTVERPIAFLFGSKTVASIWGNDDATNKASSYLKESCPDCFVNALVSRGRKYMKGEILRENKNSIIGMESQMKIYSCETYTGKASLAKVLMNSFKPSEINSQGSFSGFLSMGYMQFLSYIQHYPPMGTCFAKLVVHKTAQNPADAIEIKLKMDSNVPPGRRALPGKEFKNVKGSVTLLGPKERRWNMEINLETEEPSNVRSLVIVKVARQPNSALNLTARALCVTVKTEWSTLPTDIMETPSFVEPSVKRNVSLVWGEAPVNECPRANARGVSTLHVNVWGNITQAQKEAAFQRNSYPYDRCDLDRKEAGRSGVAIPLTEACYQAVMRYATPRSYIYDIHHENIPPETMSIIDRLETIAKAALLPYWNVHAHHGAVKKPGHIELKAEFGDDDVDLHVHTDLSHNHYKDVDILKGAENLLRNGRFELGQLAALKAGWIGICDAAPKAVLTFDNVTIPYELPNCYTLISADCSISPRFAVLARKSGKTLPLAVKIYIGGHSVELVPIGSGAIEAKVNDKIVTLEQGKIHAISDRSDNNVNFVEVEKVMNNKYFVRAPLLKLSFRYTGDDVTSFVPATYRAQHCGLCGDYNGQYSRELVGPSGCNVNNGTELAKAYVLRDKNCKDNIPVPVCNDPPAPRAVNPRFAEMVEDPFANMKLVFP